MSALVFTLRTEPPERCDLSPLTPDRLAVHDGPIEAIPIGTTRQRLTVGDIFAVAPGDPSDIRFEGGSERFDGLGSGMTSGRIAVAGNLGQRVGRAMRGGAISVSGDVGRLAGSGMIGGRIEVMGSAGDLAGGPLPGEMAGMRGGVLHIHGNAGARAGDRMRRGLISIGGRTGRAPASRMIGGTIVCFGAAGAWPGILMRRGTLVLCDGAAALMPTFPDTGTHELVAMRLIARWLIAEGIEGGSRLAGGMRRLVGDTAVLGKGEILMPSAFG